MFHRRRKIPRYPSQMCVSESFVIYILSLLISHPSSALPPSQFLLRNLDFICFNQCFSCFPTPLIPPPCISHPNRSQNSIPKREKRLRKICFNPPTLMMNIMISRIITRDMLERIPWKCITTMIIYCFDSWGDEKCHTLTGSHAGYFVGDGGAEGVEEESFERVVVEGTVGVGDVETVVTWVEGCWRWDVSVIH